MIGLIGPELTINARFASFTTSVAGSRASKPSMDNAQCPTAVARVTFDLLLFKTSCKSQQSILCDSGEYFDVLATSELRKRYHGTVFGDGPFVCVP